MAKKKVEEMAQKAELIISKESFRQQLENQIERGKELLEIQVSKVGVRTGSTWGYSHSKPTIEYAEDEFEEFKNRKKKWNDYCLELLNRSFNIPNNEYYKDFANQIPYESFLGSLDWLADYKKEIRNKIQNIESVLERIELIPCSVKEEHVLSEITDAPSTSKEKLKNIFIVYGHDVQMKQEIENFISVELKLNPISLNSQPNRGLTIIEKFEKYSSEVSYAIVLMSPDDEADVNGQIFKRARQNVIMEMGFFIAKLGRSNLCIIQKDDVEIPSDIAGILHVKFENNWKIELLREIKNAGIPV